MARGLFLALCALLSFGAASSAYAETEFPELPISYEEETNRYYFSDASEYCDGILVRWYAGTFPDQSRPIGRDDDGCDDGKLYLYDGSNGIESLTNRPASYILTEPNDRTVIIQYYADGDIISAPGSPSYDYDEPFQPHSNTENEHRLLPATTEGSTFKVDEGTCSAVLDASGGMATFPFDDQWEYDHRVWFTIIPPGENEAYGPDNWPSVVDAEFNFEMIQGSDPGSGNPACFGPGTPSQPTFLDYWDLENPHDRYEITDGEYKLFLWTSNKFRPGLNGQVAHSNAEPYGYAEVVRKDGVWYIKGQEPPDPCAEGCVSNVLFLPGIKGSRLYSADGEELWVPRLFGNDEVRRLFLGEGREDIYAHVGEVLDSAGGNDFYASFIEDMDALERESKMVDWEPVAYDWRLSLPDIVTQGAQTDAGISYTTATTTPYIEQTLRRLAASSHTGKVTIVAHSNGGLVAKELLARMRDTYGEEEVSRLVDNIVFVGVPQTGAPRSVGGLLFGYAEGLPFDKCGGIPLCSITTSRGVARELAENSPMAYHLLPSEKYFSSMAADSTPVMSFSASYPEQRDLFGDTIESYWELASFLAGDDGRVRPYPADDARPNVLPMENLSYAFYEHDYLDNWVPPATVQLYQIAGWGMDSVSGIHFGETLSMFGLPRKIYEPTFTIRGDGVVPIESALATESGTNVNDYWLDLRKYSKDQDQFTDHGDMLEVPELMQLIRSVLKHEPIDTSDYISQSEPAEVEEKNNKLLFFLYSPVKIDIYDTTGKHVGLTDEGSVESEITGSTYGEFGDTKYIIVPAGTEYHVELAGQQDGEFSIKVNEMKGDTTTLSSMIEAAPTTSHTKISFTVKDSIADASPLSIDENGDSKQDFIAYFAPGEYVPYTVSIPSEDEDVGRFSIGSAPKKVDSAAAFPLVVPVVVQEKIKSLLPIVVEPEEILPVATSVKPNTKELEDPIAPQTQLAAVYDAVQTGWLTRIVVWLYNIFSSVWSWFVSIF